MDVKKCEFEMWNAVLHKDVNRFKQLVLEDAIMICGGYRCTGGEYASFIGEFDIAEYSIKSYEEIYVSDSITQIHYIVETKVNKESDSDLAGTFHVTSSWKKCEGAWKLIFNMDSRMITV